MGPSGDDAADAELNIIPYLDIIMNLVIFLIFSFEVVVDMNQIDVAAPAYGGAGGGGEQNTVNQLSVFVHSKGYDIIPVAADGSDLSGRITIPLKGDGQYDSTELTKQLETLASQFPFGPAMLITADKTIPYKVIVKTMDASRTNSKGKDLFPQVSLAEIGQ